MARVARPQSSHRCGLFEQMLNQPTSDHAQYCYYGGSVITCAFCGNAYTPERDADGCPSCLMPTNPTFRPAQD